MLTSISSLLPRCLQGDRSDEAPVSSSVSISAADTLEGVPPEENRVWTALRSFGHGSFIAFGCLVAATIAVGFAIKFAFTSTWYGIKSLLSGWRPESNFYSDFVLHIRNLADAVEENCLIRSSEQE